MNHAARLTETAITRLTSARGPRVSELMRRARASAIAGEAPAPVLRDVEELERQAIRGGIAGQMAKAQLRIARGIAPDALLPPAPVRQDVDVHGAGCSTSAPGEPRRSTAPIPAVASDSVVNRIDSLLAVYSRG